MPSPCRRNLLDDEIVDILPKYWHYGLVDLQHPLRSLVPSLDWAVLEVLAAAESSFGVSQIGRLSSSGSRMGHSAVLLRLVEHGLVLAEPANRGLLYRFNRNHMLAPAVLLAVGLRGQLLERLRDRVAQLAPVPVHASTFGSFARGEAGVHSDIDVLLIANSDADEIEWEPQIDTLEAQVMSWTGNRCRCLVFTVERARRLAASGELIVAKWIADGVLLAGERIASVVDDTAAASSGVRRRHSAGVATRR